MDLGLRDKVVLVTGASRGIGRAIAESFAEEGARLALVATSADRCAETAAAAEAHGVETRSYGCDVADFDAMQALAKQVNADLGGIDVLVNNAGVTRDNLLLRMSEAEWDTVVDINMKGTFNACRAFARSLMKRGGAAIVNITSVVGVSGNAGQANYAASKGGVIALTKSLAKELASRQVRVNAVAPGFISTDMTAELTDADKEAMLGAIALGRLGETADIARAVVALAGSPGAYVTGQILVIDGGMMI